MLRHKLVWGLFAILGLAVFLIAGCDQTATTTTGQKALGINTTSLANGRTGIAYSQTLKASGGSGAYNWSIMDGSLPDGVSLSAKTGGISGMPNKAGTFNFTAQVSDGAGAVASQPLSIMIGSATAPLTTATGPLPNGEIKVSYSQNLRAFGGSETYAWSITGGSLPDGLALDANSGAISGTPKKPGKYLFSAQVRDSSGTVATESLSILVYTSPIVVTTSLADGEVGVIYSQKLDAVDGSDPYSYTWSISSGSLPDGLKLESGVSWNVFGTPEKSGTFDFDVEVRDSLGGTASQTLSLMVHPAIALITTSLSPARVSTAYSQTLQFSGGNGAYVWGVSEGSLPDGLTLDGNTGVISGTPKATGTSDFTVEIVDSLNGFTSQKLSITVNAA